MIKASMRVTKQGNKDHYKVLKTFGKYAEIDKIDKNWLERMSSMTEYIEIDKLEEVNEDITRGCSGYS